MGLSTSAFALYNFACLSSTLVKDLCRPMAPDRITNLPCHIMDHILTYLPLRDAVRTSILSREWRYKWVTTPHLDFGWSFQHSFNLECSLISIIYQILLLHKGPIVKFSFENDYAVDHLAIDCWLQFLSKHHIEDFSLMFYDLEPDYNYVLPHHLFRFEHLRRLNLQNVVLKTPVVFKGFSRLVKLELAEICIDLEAIKRFLSKCPNIEFLDIHNCNDTFWYLDIDAPNLKSFSFAGRLCSICLKSASLEELSVSYYDSDLDDSDLDRNVGMKSNGGESNLVKGFSHQPSIKMLKFNHQVLEFMAMGVLLQKPANLDNLTCLHLCGIEIAKLYFVTSTFYLIRSSPNLQHLEIACSYKRSVDMNEESATIQYMKEQQECKIPLNRLETVTIKGLSGLKSEMEFVKLLLLQATGLEKLRAVSSLYDKDRENLQLLKELASFRRVSSKAVLLFE